MLPSTAFPSDFWLWITREEVRAALTVILFDLVLIGVRVGIFSVSYVFKIVFLCECELLF